LTSDELSSKTETLSNLPEHVTFHDRELSVAKAVYRRKITDSVVDWKECSMKKL